MNNKSKNIISKSNPCNGCNEWGRFCEYCNIHINSQSYKKDIKSIKGDNRK